MSKKILIAIIFAAAIAAFFYTGLHNFFTLENLQAQRENWQFQYQQKPVLFITLFFLIYVACTSLALPAAALLTVASGALFGFWIGLIIVSFASSIGATIAFIATRYLFRDSVESKFSSQLEKINTGIEREGALYVFGLRLVPIFPFFLINSLLALTKIKTSTFYIASQIGMFIGTSVFVYAGQQIGQISSLNDILSPQLILAFALLGIFPIAAKHLMSFIRTKRS